MFTVRKPIPSELNKYYQTYLKYVPEDNLIDALLSQETVTDKFLNSISESNAGTTYAEGKWLLKEVVGHICDAERILAYRALRISRNDKTPLPGFEENDYTPNSNYSKRSLENIAAEFKTIRAATVSLFINMNEEMFDRKGSTNNFEVAVRDLLFFIIGNERHHLKVIEERYLS